MIGDQLGHVEAFDLAVNYPPLAANHHAVGLVGAAQQQGGNRVVAAGEAQLIQFEEGQVGLLAHCQFADIAAPQQLGRTLAGPAQHQFRGDFFGAVAQALDIQSLTRFENHVRGIVGGRAIHADADGCAGGFQVEGRTDARGQAHIRAWAMADAGPGLAEAGDFIRVEVDAVGQPGARAEPADAIQIVNGAQAEALQAEVFFVEGFRQVGVQAHVQFLGQFGALAHDFLSH